MPKTRDATSPTGNCSDLNEFGKKYSCYSGLQVPVFQVLILIVLIKSTIEHFWYNNVSYVVIDSCGDNNFRNDAERIIFAWYQLAVMFIIPVAIMSYCYAIVIHVLWLSNKQLARMTRPTSEDGKHRLTTGDAASKVQTKDQTQEVREARKQVIKMLMTIIAVFLICWGPKLILKVMKRHEIRSLHSDASFVADIIINLLPYIQSSANPVIYGFMSKNFRRSLQKAFRTQCGCDIVSCCKRRPEPEFDMMTKSVTVNGQYSWRYSPSRTRRTSMTHMTDI